MNRIASGLRWAGGALLVAAVALVAAAIGWTQTAHALLTASAVAALALGLPGFLADLAATQVNAGRVGEASDVGAA